MDSLIPVLSYMLLFYSSRLNKFLQYLTEAGFRVSRTHFDPTGVRTDATLEQFKSVLTKYSVSTYNSTPSSANNKNDASGKTN